MSKLSTFLHAHANVVDHYAGLFGMAITIIPMPSPVKMLLLGAVDEMKGAADNLRKNANTIEQELLQDMLAGVQSDAPPPVTAEHVQQLTDAGSVARAAASELHSFVSRPVAVSGTTPANPPAQPGDPAHAPSADNPPQAAEPVAVDTSAVLTPAEPVGHDAPDVAATAPASDTSATAEPLAGIDPNSPNS